MGLFLSFLGGAAEGFSEEVDKSEKEAKAYAAMATKSLYEQKIENDKANAELSGKMKADRDFVLANKPDATPDQIQALLSNPEVMKKYRAYENPTDVDLNNLIKIAKTNPSVAVAAENVEAFPELQNKAKEVLSTIQKKRTGLGGFIDSMGERAGGTAAAQTATALGTTMEALQGSKRLARPTSDAVFNMKVLEKPETFTDATDKAKMALLTAQRSNDPVALAQAVVNMAKITNTNSLSDKQKTYAEEVGAIKQAYMFGTAAERAEAKPKYEKWLSDVRAEAQAKKVGESGADSKIPQVGTLLNLAKTAVANAVTSQMGTLVGKGIMINPVAGGGVEIVNTLTDEASNKRLKEVSAAAVKDALSLYTDAKGAPINKDVATVLNMYTPKYTPQPGSVPTEPAPPLPPAKPVVAAAPAPATPAAIPTVKPAVAAQPAPVAQPTKTVSVAKVQEQAKANNVTYEQAAAEARKQGYQVK